MAKKKTAGVFDVRNVIGSLLGIYGVILVLLGIFGEKDPDKSAGVNANLWAGIILIVVGLVFLIWNWLRPVVVESDGTNDAPEK